MYEILLGYILGLFTVLAWNLQKSGKVNFAFYQWLIVALIISILVYIIHRFIAFDFTISKESFFFSFESFLLPVLIVAIIVCYLIYKVRKKKKDIQDD